GVDVDVMADAIEDRRARAASGRLDGAEFHDLVPLPPENYYYSVACLLVSGTLHKGQNGAADGRRQERPGVQHLGQMGIAHSIFCGRPGRWWRRGPRLFFRLGELGQGEDDGLDGGALPGLLGEELADQPGERLRDLRHHLADRGRVEGLHLEQDRVAV